MGLENDDGERASTGDVFAKECRAANIGLELFRFGLKLLAGGGPDHD